MGKFRTRAGEFEAVQWQRNPAWNKELKLPDRGYDISFVRTTDTFGVTCCDPYEDPSDYVEQGKSRQYIESGDWIVTGAAGMKLVIPQHLFALFFEPAETGPVVSR